MKLQNVTSLEIEVFVDDITAILMVKRNIAKKRMLEDGGTASTVEDN